VAHKITNSDEAIKLMQSKAVSIDTLASAIVRGKGLNMSDNKREFLEEYTRVSNRLYSEFSFLFAGLFDEEWAKRSE
jgi:phosphoribosylaminoimidazole-succinocarboxamide synthase